MDRKKLKEELNSFKSDIQKLIAKQPDPVSRAQIAIPFIKERLLNLRRLVLADGFQNGEEEIYFFKIVKPDIRASLIFEIELYKINIDQPAGTRDMIEKYWLKQLGQIHEFFKEYHFQYQYFKSNSQELDDAFFKRGQHLNPIAIYKLPDVDPDPDFSTEMDFLFARFLAAERLQQYFIEKIDRQSETLSNNHVPLYAVREYNWTGDGINLIEIAYGIWLTGQLNNGNAGISEIVQMLEANFNIKLGRAYRRWTEISRRKQISTTKYLDEMTRQINLRVDSENAVKSEQRRAGRKSD